MNLSYIIVTRNRLPFLTKAIENLVAHKLPDEEIVVVDGNSTDGTVEYLEEMKKRGDVDQYVSGPDKSLGHAINKGILMAKGELMKTMSDDDVYYYDEMQKCKEFLLAHPEIDALGTNGTAHDGSEYDRAEDFLLWKNTPYHPFMIGEQGLWLRKSSLALFGLTDTSFTYFWDAEFTVRLTAGRSRIAWYTGKTWEHVLHEGSISRKRPDLWMAESKRLRRMYPIYSTWKHYIPKPVRDVIRFFFPKKQLSAGKEKEVSTPTFLY